MWLVLAVLLPAGFIAAWMAVPRQEAPLSSGPEASDEMLALLGPDPLIFSFFTDPSNGTGYMVIWCRWAVFNGINQIGHPDTPC